MTTDQWIAVASIAAVLVSAIAIVVALTSVRDQLQVTVFLTYMDRYTRAMHDLPFEARRPGIEYQIAGDLGLCGRKACNRSPGSPASGRCGRACPLSTSNSRAFREFVRDKLLPYAVASENALSSVIHRTEDQGSVPNPEAALTQPRTAIAEE